VLVRAKYTTELLTTYIGPYESPFQITIKWAYGLIKEEARASFGPNHRTGALYLPSFIFMPNITTKRGQNQHIFWSFSIE
jgi:hypothetical protein